MIEIKGYWIINGTKSEFIEGPTLIHAKNLEEYRKMLSDVYRHDILFKHRLIPDDVKKLIVSDFMQNQPTIKDLAIKYGVSESTVTRAIEIYLTNDDL